MKKPATDLPFPGISVMDAWDRPPEDRPQFQLSSHDKWFIEQQTREDITSEEADEIFLAELM